MNRAFASLVALALLAVSPASGLPLKLHYAPKERVDLIDVALIGRAKLSIRFPCQSEGGAR